MAVEKILMFTMAVTDMAKAKAFYADKLGFQVTRDYGQGDQHWVSLDAPGGGASLNLTTMHENMKPGSMLQVRSILCPGLVERIWHGPI